MNKYELTYVVELEYIPIHKDHLYIQEDKYRLDDEKSLDN